MNSAELIFTENISETFSDLCKRYQIEEPIVFCDSNTAQYCLPRLSHPNVRSIVMPAGEMHKNLNQCVELIQALEAAGADRQTVLINLGGGVVSDLGGFAASVFQRGIRFVNVPTTLLAMVDASIGGKTGVDFKDLKNYVGSFSQPLEIIVSTEFLDENFPEQEFRSAWAEIIKSAAMFDADFFSELEQGTLSLELVIRKCAELKKRITDSDFHDKGERQKLNFGHTIGHAFESYRLEINQPVLHGYAVAAGMKMELGLSIQLGMISELQAKRILDLIEAKVPTELIGESDFEAMRKYLIKDKKNSSGLVSFALPVAVGVGRSGISLKTEEINFLKFKV